MYASTEPAVQGVLGERLRITRPWPVRLLRSARRRPIGAIGVLIILTIVFMAIFADFITPYSPVKIFVGPKLAAPSAAHLLGTDEIGRDILSRLIFGARISLFVGILAVGIGTSSGSLIGLISGFFEGKVDMIIQRIVDAMMAFPGLILAMALVAILGPNTINGMLAIAVTIMPGDSRVVRSAVLAVKQNAYVDSARAIGCPSWRILFFHILPNITAPIMVLATTWLASAIIIEASLSFLGLGTQLPTPSWGNMLSVSGRIYMEIAPWMALSPGLAISIAVLGFNMFGDTLRDAWDPKLRGR